MSDNRVNSISIQSQNDLISAMKQMDVIDKKSLLVFNDNNEFVNIITIGDIQRAILNDFDLKTPIQDILRQNTRLSSPEITEEEIKNTMREFRMEIMPVVDSNKKLIKVYFWEDFFATSKRLDNVNLGLPVVIMAGGFGTRMQPLTSVIPKPLIPMGNQSMLEHIIGNFQKVGCNDFYISVNYKAELIKFYFDDIKDKTYNIDFFKEPKPLGTAGSLSLLKGKFNSPFFVSNCDILINDDYEAIYKYHKENKNELTIVSALKAYQIPYGTLKTTTKGVLKEITEKPELNYQINTGFYLIEPHLLDEIPENEFFHITHLMEKLLKEGRKVGAFPISEGSWLDVGQWDEYNKTASKLGFKGFD
ncbi:nucleotidyltransferase family protein [Patiriisocius marinus]|uniref:nucleotidyltransferase family protein n=1 Tax=Patiriisocius marinus TaxID=1397112 RepID=UPI0023305842|nr:nucleotidyltransferase family protein [Patiriisocius marinus]